MAQPSLTDVTPGFDPTGYASITAAQLEQLVGGITPFTDKGYIVTTTDIAGVAQVPDATTNTKWQRYFWRRISPVTNSLVVYSWNPNAAADPTLSQWVSITIANIGVGTLNGNVLQDHSVTSQQISSITQSQVSPSLATSFLGATASAGGDLAGNYPNPTVALGVITGDTAGNGTGKIAANTIVSHNIKAKSILPTSDIAGNGVAKTILQSAVADPTGLEFIVPSSIINSTAGIVTTANQFKIPQVATAGAGDTGTWQMALLSTIRAQANNRYTLANTAITANGNGSAAHGLGAMPTGIRAVLVNTGADLSYGGSNQEFPISCFMGPSNTVPVVVYADATSIFWQMNASLSWATLTQGTGAQAGFTAADWRLKVYVEL